MDFTMLIMAFGGGVLAAAIGGVPSFVFTGLIALAAIFGGEAGAPMVTLLAFGSFFGPHVAFAGNVAAAAYAKQKGLLEDGMDIVTPLYKTQDAMVLIIGGVFGIIGFLIQYLYAQVLGGMVFGLIAWTDTVALTVFTSGVIVRLIFTKSGLLGKYDGTVKRAYFPASKRMTFLIVIGLGIGIAIGGAAAGLGTMAMDGDKEALYLFQNIGSIGFGIAAVSLAFSCMGLPLEAYHHVILPAGSTAMILFASTGNSFISIIGAAIMGIATSLFGESAALTLNSYSDSHIDPPATTIMIAQLINFCLLSFIFPATGVFI